ncbi:BnaA05g27730D [Brassica napus]|uniref:Laccase n=1 Tax=Brassica napus TaxID=3708 RepID=A0A078F622_BRANA|nr:BnaA05g27730D [Brassica napus]
MTYSCARIFLLVFLSLLYLAEANIRHYKFNVVMKNMTKLCSTKPIVTINGKFPGPTLYAREDDNVIVNLTNNVSYNVTIHWHGVKQLRTGWSDGPAYITQCPKKYNFHSILIYFHFFLLFSINFLFYEMNISGEWWKSDVEDVIKQSTQSGLPPNLSDAHTINGLTGPITGCNNSHGYTIHVETGKSYLLRIINAAVNDELFFKIAQHNLTVVEVDASYTKPYNTETLFLGPGQTANAVLTANHPTGNFLMTISPFMDTVVPVDNATATAFLRYKNTTTTDSLTMSKTPPINATSIAQNFSDSLRSLNSLKYPTNVPLKIDHSLFFAIGVGVNPCATCINGTKTIADINNVTFVMPTMALLQAHYFNKSQGVFTDDFPGRPLTPFDYTGGNNSIPLSNLQTKNGTQVYRLEFNATVQIVIQGTSVIAPESHPTHLHGSNFFVVGKGLGNFDPLMDPKKFNLVDPVERNTVSVPTAGWTAIRFIADNPGVWFFHCHLEVHTSWGLKMAFLVEDGKDSNEKLPPPPSDLPKC